MKKDYPKIKMSNKSRFRIMAAVKKAFNEVTGQFECYDSPPEMWMDSERELWDTLQEMELKAIDNLKKIIQE